MATITEIAILKIKESTKSLEGPSEDASVWQDTINTILEQDGALSLYWGTAVEDPSLVRLFVEWNSIDDHKKFKASGIYTSFIHHLFTIISEVTLMAHADLKPLPQPAREVFTSPAAELLTVWFPAEYTAAQQAKVEADMQELVKAVEGKAEGIRAATAGWGIEDDIANLKQTGVKGKAFFFFIGWESIQHHLDFRGTEAFKENIHLLRDAEGMQDFLNMHFHGKEVISKK